MSNSQGSHRAARGRGRTAAVTPRGPVTAVVPGPSPVPLHEELTLAAWPLHAPTAVDLVAGGPAPVTGPRTGPWQAPTVPAFTVPPVAATPTPTLPAFTVPTPTVPAFTVPAPGGRAGARRAARRRRVPVSSENLRRLVPQALVVAFLAGGTTAFVADDKAVTLDIDGEPRTLHTFADDVGELLADQGIAAGGAETVFPAPGSELGDGDEITVRSRRPVTLTLDGVRRRVWTSEHTVGDALRRIGVRAEGAYLSVSRAAPIGRTGLALDVRTERTVTVMADGREHTVRTNAATVREAVARAGVTLRGEDTTSVAPDSFPRDGQTVSVLRITTTREVREEPLAYAVERTGDSSLAVGTEVVEREGRDGSRRVLYTLRTVNGVRQKPREVDAELVRVPVSRVVRAGTGSGPAGKPG
ncbi:ubiquitin-like domain-containing protein [Streptomyces sp. NPDC091265]|uniref:ubiquitin-like domain-containing protein n=1 Tax=unclassified Streptomyces TaxID=2593676 RepID=UPI00344C9F24